MEQKDIDSLMHPSKAEIVSGYRSRFEPSHGHHQAERYFSTALFLMASLVEFHLCTEKMQKGKENKTKDGKVIPVTFHSFLNALCLEFAENKKFFSEMSLFLFHLCRSVLSLPVVANNMEFSKFYRNKDHCCTKFS